MTREEKEFEWWKSLHIGRGYAEETMKDMFNLCSECWRSRGSYDCQLHKVGFAEQTENKCDTDFMMILDCSGCDKRRKMQDKEPITIQAHEGKTNFQSFDGDRTGRIYIELVQKYSTYMKDETAIDTDYKTGKTYRYRAGIGWWNKQDKDTGEYKRSDWYHFRMPYDYSQTTITGVIEYNGEKISIPMHERNTEEQPRYEKIGGDLWQKYLSLPLEHGSILVQMLPPELFISITKERLEQEIEIAIQNESNIRYCNMTPVAYLVPVRQLAAMYGSDGKATDNASRTKVELLYWFAIIGDKDKEKIYKCPLPYSDHDTDVRKVYLPIELVPALYKTKMFEGNYDVKHNNVMYPDFEKIKRDIHSRTIIDADGCIYRITDMDIHQVVLQQVGSIL